MRTVSEIYEEYRLMPGLQLHQLRVGAVAKSMCDAIEERVDTRAVILAALFHDMANILKSDFTTFPDFLGDKSAEYWQSVKDDCAARYGTQVHAATVAMCREIGLDERAIELIDGMGFSRMKETRDSGDIERMIVEYADSRVAPRAILPLRERLEDARERYRGKIDDSDTPTPSHEWMELADAASDIEAQLFKKASMHPEDISDASVAPLIEELKHFRVR